MSKLPFDVWYHVACYVDRTDLLQLALVSKDTVDPVRRVLAREVTLRGNEEDTPQLVLDYLLRTGLSYCVRKLVFRGFDMRKQVPRVPFSSMPRLFSLAVEYRTPPPSSEQRRCNDVLSRQNFLLFRSKFVNITDLDILISARSRDFDAYTELPCIRFPNLLSLKIGPGHKDLNHMDYDSGDAITGLTRFLLLHPTIISLVLSHTEYPSETAPPVFISFNKNLISEAFLPNLRSLDAHPSQIAEFVDARAAFLPNLVSLSISENRHENLDNALAEMWAMFHQYNASENDNKNSAWAVQHFHLKLRKVRGCTKKPPTYFTDPMMALLRMFPDLQSWSGDLPPIDKTLFQHFPRFLQLRELTCRFGYLRFGAGRVAELAKRCPFLERVTCRVSGVCYEISREGEADNQAVVVQPHNRRRYSSPHDEEISEANFACPSSDHERQGGDEESDGGSCRTDVSCDLGCEQCHGDRRLMSSDDDEEEYPHYSDDSSFDEDSEESSSEDSFADDD